MNMADHVEMLGKVIEVNRDKFVVLVENTGENEMRVHAQLSGKMRMNKIRVTLHDKVRVKTSPYDLSLGFIVSRE